MTGPVVVLTFDPVGPAMAGPAIRAWNLARALAGDGHEVVLASTAGVTGAPAEAAPPGLTVRDAGGGDGLDGLLAAAAAVVAPGSVVARHGPLLAPATPLAVDLYVPSHLENLEPGGRAGAVHDDDVRHQVAVVNADLRRGDAFFCASERQRDFWLGALASAGRVTPATYHADPTLRALLDVMPYGLPDRPPAAGGPVLRRRFAGVIGPADPVVVWGGGVYEWFDPLVVVHAASLVAREVPGLRVVFLGMRNPNPAIPEMRLATRLRALADDLGVAGSTVLFNDEWVPQAEWGATLLDADAAVSTHPDHVETRFSFRTRVLDYIWARRPMVLTGGDELSEVVGRAGAAVVVAPGDVDAVAAGLRRVLTVPVPDSAWTSLLERYRWATVVAPLLAWAADPRVAADRAVAGSARQAGATPPAQPAPQPQPAPPPAQPQEAARPAPPEVRAAAAGLPAAALTRELGRRLVRRAGRRR